MNLSDMTSILIGTNSFHIKCCVLCLKMLDGGGGHVAVYTNLFLYYKGGYGYVLNGSEALGLEGTNPLPLSISSPT